MKNQHLTFDERIAAIRGISVKEAHTVKDLTYSVGVLENTIRLMKDEISRRKHDSKN